MTGCWDEKGEYGVNWAKEGGGGWHIGTYIHSYLSPKEVVSQSGETTYIQLLLAINAVMVRDFFYLSHILMYTRSTV